MSCLKNHGLKGLITGFSSNYIRVEYPWQARLGRAGKKS